MKHCFTILLLLPLLVCSPAIGQSGTTKLLKARATLYFNDPFIQIAGDSSTFEYNSNLQTDKVQTWYFDDGPNIWELISRVINHSYDFNGNLLSSIEQRGDGPNGWENYARHKNTYNGDNQHLSLSFEGWDGMDWGPENITYWQYDTNGNVISETFEFGLVRYLFAYNAQSLLEVKTKQYLLDGNWENLDREVYTYLPNATKITSIIQYKWENSTWQEDRRISHTYDSSGDLVILLEEIWDGISWGNIQKYLFEYDSNHNNIFWVRHFWGSGDWEEVFRKFSTFDTESYVLNTSMESRFLLNNWTVQETVNYYYTEFVSTNNPMIADFQAFPNPTTSSLTLQGENLAQAKIFDQQGRQVRAQILHGQAEETIQLGNLPTGNYLLQAIGTDGKVGAKPLQIRH